MHLIKMLKAARLLEDTLVTFGVANFGRTVYSQGTLNLSDNYGRDHHPRCFTTWNVWSRRQARF